MDKSKFVEEMVSNYVEEASWDAIGFWQIVASTRERIPSTDDQRFIIYAIIRKLLDMGFYAGNLDRSPQGFAPWIDQEPDHVLQHLKREWEEKGTEPYLIAWFWPVSAKSKVRQPN